MQLNRNTPILIAGAGTFGLSTAWNLAKAGYTNIKVLDKHLAPSKDSAGYDLNKVFRTEYSDPLYSKLSLEAREMWLGEKVLKGCYHESGYIFAVLGKSEKSVKNWQDAVANSRMNGVQLESLETPADFRRKCPVMTGSLEGWRGVYNAKAGWTHAFKSLKAIHEDCTRMGVTFASGPEGTVVRVIYGENGAATGVMTADGTQHHAEKIILACGAWMDTIIDTYGQCLAKSWCFIHLQMTDEEATLWKDMPVINNRELGYMFEPDVDGKRLKIAPHSVGYTHYVAPRRSFPRSKNDFPSDGIPTQARATIRELLRSCLPHLADRPFVHEQLCWDADTPDANFLIAEHPEHQNLFVAGGASAHGFKFLPNIGKYIKDLVEGNLQQDLAQAWRWRPYQIVKQDTSRPDLPNVGFLIHIPSEAATDDKRM